MIVHFGIKARAAIVVSSDSLDELRDVIGRPPREPRAMDTRSEEVTVDAK